MKFILTYILDLLDIGFRHPYSPGDLVLCLLYVVSYVRVSHPSDRAPKSVIIHCTIHGA